MSQPRDSYIVRKFGLDGVREHFMPGNRRRGTPVRAKRAFDGEAAAMSFVQSHRDRGIGWRVYQCSVCGKWHTASPRRHGDPR